jgi:cardiolipin synthase C
MNLYRCLAILKWPWRVVALSGFGICCLMFDRISADEWRVLDRDEDAIAERINLIELAQHDISIACYDTDAGYVTNLIAENLVNRIRAGVRVRFLIDGLPSREMYDRLQEYSRLGIDVKVFHPLGMSRPTWLNRRLHSKIMVCDDTAMIIGSRNLSDAHFGLSNENFIDCDYLITGETCVQGRQYFEWIWNHCGAITVQALTGHLLSDPISDGQVKCLPLGLGTNAAESNRVAEGLSHFCERYSATFQEHQGQMIVCDDCQPHLSGTACPNELTLIHDLDFKKRCVSLDQEACQAIDASRCRIMLETPYPAFSQRMMQALLEAARRGVAVTMMTNSSATTDRAITYAAFQNHKRSLVRAGVELREYGDPGRIHAKGIVIDNDLAWVGSYNFDPRGDRLNLELCLRITDPEFVKAVAATMYRRNSNSQALSSRDSIFLSPTTPLPKRLKIRSLQLVTPFLRRTL